MKHIVSFSGGKDSTAMLLRMLEQGCHVDEIIIADTTLEYPVIYEYIEKVSNFIERPITILNSDMTFEERFYGQRSRGKRKDSGIIRGFPPTYFGCWINRDIKVRALDIYAKSQTDLVQYIGITADESHRTRARAYNKRDSVFKFPLVTWGWTGADCTRYLDSIGLTHPLKGLRTGCWLCPKQTKESLHYLYTEYPELWKRLREYEKEDIYGFSEKHDLDRLEREFDSFNKHQTFLDSYR